MFTTPTQYYNQRIRSLETELKKLASYFRLFFALRSLFFLAFIAFLIFYIKSDYRSIYLWFSGVSLAAFLAIVKCDLLYHARERLAKTKLLLNNNELKYLDYQFTGFEDGKNYESLNPALAGDFDLFGEGSLFQYFNRCVTRTGTAKFAEALCTPLQQVHSIREKQKAVEELSEKVDFLEDFRSRGMLTPENGDEAIKLEQWLSQPIEKQLKLKIISYLYPSMLILWITIITTGHFSLSSIIIPLVAAYFILYIFKNKIEKAHDQLNNSAAIFEKYAALIEQIETETFKSPHLSQLKNQFSVHGLPAGQSLKKLFRLLEFFDYRKNMIISPILNSLFVFDLHTYSALQRWKAKHKSVVPGWFSSLSTLDALSGFAVFRFNNPLTTFPEPEENAFIFEAHDLGHPLIPSKARVNNDLALHKNPKVMIITGANMAGKSTFLRAMGVNLVLAMNGAPVCATNMRFTPCPLVSSINIRDSLTHSESYFYAELIRLKSIIKQVENQPATLIFLDEILRGTNSQDKHTGTMGLLEKLIALGAIVVIATHDLGVGQLAGKYPAIATNHCFEVELENDQLVFDYKLKPGISQKLNASFLMQKMGLIE